MTDITADVYRTAAKVDRHHGGQSAAQFCEDNARVIEAAEADSLTTQLAKAMFESNAGLGWSGVSESVREIYIRAADTVLAHLQSANRLIPAGGMALTAEQVEDVRELVGILDLDDEEFWNLRSALFPATEPTEGPRELICPCRGRFGFHDCNTVSTPAEPTEEHRSFPTIQDVPNNTLFHTHGGNGSSLFVRNQSGDLRLCLNAGPEWSKLLQEGDFPPFSGPFVEVPWSKFPQPPADPFAQPAPAEPAEEETKAGTADAMQRRFIAEIRSMNPDMVISKRLDDLEAELNASSPVVPAPAETGPWQTWQEVPEGRTVQAKNRHTYTKRDGILCIGTSTMKSCMATSTHHLAPFVAA